MSAGAKATEPKLEIWIEADDGRREKLGLNPVMLGSRSRIWAIITINGNSFPAEVAQWTFPSNVMFVSDFQFAQNGGAPAPVVTEGPNPVEFVPWCIITGQPGLPPPLTQAVIQCIAEAPGGIWLPCQDVLPITFPLTSLNSVVLQQGEAPAVENSPMGPSWLSYSADEGLKIDFNYAGLPAGAQLGMIQLVDTVRNYGLENGTTAVLASTNGAFFLDALPNTVFFNLEPIVDPGNNDFVFADRPQQPIPLTFNSQNVEASFASDQFLLYVLYKATPGMYDPNNLWVPIALYGWGWYGRAVLNDDDDGFDLDPENSAVLNFGPTSLTPLAWAGWVNDTVLQPNGAPGVAMRQRSK
jgi:hypothetical protein